MSIVDCLFAETERFHQGDGDLVDQLMDRIRGAAKSPGNCSGPST